MNLTPDEIQHFINDLQVQRNEALTQCALLNARLNVALARIRELEGDRTSRRAPAKRK